MLRRRLLIVVLIAAVWAVLVPLPSPAASRVPTTVDRTFELARGQRLKPTRALGASTERASRRLPIRANLVAISFRTDSRDLEAIEDGITITARFHTNKGWSSWEVLHLEPEEAPDATSVEGKRASDRIFTAPIWVGTADAMAFRAAAAAGAPAVFDLRAHVINTLGDASPPSPVHRVVGVISRFLRGGDPAEAMTSTPKIISRSGWGANESWRECCPRYAPEVKMAFVHHTAGTNSYSKSESPAVVRSVYRFHTSNRGWSDIGYNFLVDRYGQIFEGRYGGMTRPVIGAHVLGFNTGSTGISLMGTFQTATPPSAMISSLKRLLAWKMDVHHIPPVGKVTMRSGGNPKYPAGKNVSLNRISGHRDGQQTSCPGTKAYYLLPSVRSAVNNIGLPKIYLPTSSPGILRPDGNGVHDTITVRGTLSTRLSWAVEFRTLGGTLARRLTGYGSSVAATWDGKGGTGTLSDYMGVIRYTIIAGSASAGSARSATGEFNLVTKHPNGTVLRTPTRTVVLEDGKTRLIPSPLVLNSWYRAVDIVNTTDVEVNRYPSGSPLDLREGTLLKEPDGTYAIFSDGEVRQFTDGVYAALGYTAGSALAIGALELAALPSGPNISDSSRHPEGSVVRASDGSVWTIGATDRHRNPTVAMWKARYRAAEIVPMIVGDVPLPVTSPMTYREGTMLRLSDGTLWIVSGGQKRRFWSDSLFLHMGYQAAGILSITTTEAKAIPTGPTIA